MIKYLKVHLLEKEDYKHTYIDQAQANKNYGD